MGEINIFIGVVIGYCFSVIFGLCGYKLNGPMGWVIGHLSFWPVIVLFYGVYKIFS